MCPRPRRRPSAAGHRPNAAPSCPVVSAAKIVPTNTQTKHRPAQVGGIQHIGTGVSLTWQIVRRSWNGRDYKLLEPPPRCNGPKDDAEFSARKRLAAGSDRGGGG